MWFITLLVLALAAFLIVKAVKAQSARKSADKDRQLPDSGLTGRLDHKSMDAGSTTVSAAATTAATTAATSAATSATAGATATGAVAAGSAATTGTADESTGDQLHDIREMIKILNLAEPDAARLDITPEQFAALRAAGAQNGTNTASSLPSDDKLADVAHRLRTMIA
jgi:hypothetical protein